VDSFVGGNAALGIVGCIPPLGFTINF